MRQSLAVKYRPTEFKDVVGQNITTVILNKAVETGTFKNAYLFAGASGCGKTTLARCFANKINKGFGKPIEIDAASNGGVDNVRAIISSANQRSLDSEYKIFIIDECHAITPDGWKAFLKSIEETPDYTIYIFCTTDPNKVPPMILNRVQRYNISKIGSEDIKKRLAYICQQEGFTNYDQACDFISKLSHGSMRDAITNLEQCATYSTDLSINNVKAVLSSLSFEHLFKLTWAIKDKDIGSVLSILDELYNEGSDLKIFIENYLEFALDLSKYSIFRNIKLTNIPEYLATEDNPVVQHTVNFDGATAWVNSLIELLLKIKLETKYDTNYKSTIEAFFISFCK